MAVMPAVAPWKDILTDTAGSLDIQPVTPAASLQLLTQANSLVHRALSMPYAVTGLSCDTSNTTTINATATVSGKIYKIVTAGSTNFVSIGAESDDVGQVFVATGAGSGTGTVKTLWYWAQRVNAGCAYLRPRTVVGVTPAAGDVEVPKVYTGSTSSSLTTTSAIISCDIEATGTIPDYPPGASPVVTDGADTYNGSPSAIENRAYEVHSLDTAGANPADNVPYTEGFAGTNIHGMAALWTERDMSGL